MNLTIKGTDKSFRLSNVVRPTTKRLKPKSNLIVPSSLLTDLDRRSQLRNENRSFQERGRRGGVNTSSEPILSIRFKSRRNEARRSKRNARGVSRWTTWHWRIYRNQYISSWFRKWRMRSARLIDAFHESSSVVRLFSFRSFDRLSSDASYWKYIFGISRALSRIKVLLKAPFLREERVIKRRRQA